MNRAEALKILGVDESTDRKSVRQAYLRLVKQHKPDQDPEGFQRVREAYEVASAPAFDLEEWLQRTSFGRRKPASATEPSPDAQSASGADLPPVEVDEDALFAFRVFGSPSDLDESELERLKDSDDAVLILRTAHLRTSEEANDPHLEDLVVAGLAAVGPEDPAPLEASLRLIPRLLRREQIDLANQLLQAARDSLVLQGGGAAMSPETTLFYYLLEEFVSLSPDFPAGAYEIILQGLATGDLIDADDGLMVWARENPTAARSGAAKIQSCPELRRYFGVTLDVPDSSATASFDSFRMVSIVMMILAINVLPRACNQSRSYSTTPPPPRVTVGSYQSDLGAACGTKLPVGTPVERPCGAAIEVIRILTERDCSRVFRDGTETSLEGLVRLTAEIPHAGWSATRENLERLTASRLRPAWQRLEASCPYNPLNVSQEPEPSDE